MNFAGGREAMVAKRRPGFFRLVSSALRLTWRADRRGSVVAGGWQVVGALSASAAVLIGKYALESIVGIDDGSSGLGPVVLLIALLASLTAITSAARTLQQQQQRILNERVSSAGWAELLDVCGSVGLENYESSQFFDRLERVRANAVVAPSQITTSVFGLIGGAFATVGLVIVLCTIAPVLVPVLLLAGLPTVLLARKAGQLEFEFVKRVVGEYRSRDYLRQILTNQAEAKEVRAFGAGHALRGRHDARSRTYIDALTAHVKVRRHYALAGVAVAAAALAATLALVVWLLSDGRISLAEAGAAAIGARLLSTNLTGTFTSIGGLFESSTYLRDLDDFVSDANSERSADRSTGVPAAFRERISVTDLSYTYLGAEAPALTGINVEVGQGEVVALVGENGSGKTTLAKLIAGLYTPTSGQITWDGRNAQNDLVPSDVRRSVAVIFQDFVHYKLSAYDNVGIGAPEEIDDQEAVRQIAEFIGADSFLRSLPRGYDTILSKEFADGTDLSVGQWQRVALARAMRKNAPLVILDEPTSAMDPRAEDELFGDIRQLLRGRAALLISHRYSTVRKADRIYVMDKGRIVEVGTHEELMEAQGLYADLFSLQAKAYLR